MKIAMVHDWLVTYAGAERVLEALLECFPTADLFSVIDFVPENERGFLKGKKPQVSFIQKLPFAKNRYRLYLGWMPLAVEQFDLSGYDLVISSSHAVAKGVLTGPDQLHISYVHSPMRYAWDLQHQYLRETGLDRGLKGFLARRKLHQLRLWDARSALGVDRFIANSRYIARRILKVYRRDATVIYPPVDLESCPFSDKKEDFYLTASRLVPYKKVAEIVKAFEFMPNRRLVVIGDGPDFEKIAKQAGTNVTLLGYQSSESLKDHLKRARAFLYMAEEDFGILPVEAQACGTPVLAFKKGGLSETILGLDVESFDASLGAENLTGLFFSQQTAASLRQAIETFELHQERFSAKSCAENAARFSKARFKIEIEEFIKKAMSEEGSKPK